MRVLDFYIGRSIVAGTLIAVFALTSLDVFFALASELDDVGTGQYQVMDAFVYIALTLPGKVYEYFPASVLIGSLLSLGGLAANSELVAMRAAGVSIARIARAAVQAAFVMALFIAMLGEFVVPPAIQQAESFRSGRVSAQLAMSEEGIWVRDGHRYINIKKLFPDARISGLQVYEFGPGNRLVEMLSAEMAVQQTNKDWVLQQVERRVFVDGEVRVSQAAQEVLPKLFEPGLLEMLKKLPDAMSLRELREYVRYLQDNKLDASVYELAYWMKLVAPLSSVVMLLLALPFVFGFLRNVNAGQLMLVGILLGLSFYILIRVASNVGQIYGAPPFLSATLPMLLVLSASLLALRRVR